MRDEDVGGLLVPLKLAEEVQDRSLDGDVESGGRLVADDDARITGERPCDRDALLEPARERCGPNGEVPVGEPDGAGQREHAVVPLASVKIGQPLECPADDPLDCVPLVQRLVGVLEDDLDRADVVVGALPRRARKLVVVEHDHRLGIGLRDPQEHARERRLAAPGLSDEPECLARPELD